MSDRAASVTAWEALFRAQVAVIRKLNAEFPDQLSLNEYDVLFNLSRQSDRQLRIRDLNKHLLLTQPSVSRLVDRLAVRGLVRKSPDPGDGRGTIVELTEAGYELFRVVAIPHSTSIHSHMSALSDAELATLTELCDKLRHGVAGS